MLSNIGKFASMNWTLLSTLPYYYNICRYTYTSKYIKLSLYLNNKPDIVIPRPSLKASVLTFKDSSNFRIYRYFPFFIKLLNFQIVDKIMIKMRHIIFLDIKNSAKSVFRFIRRYGGTVGSNKCETAEKK